LIFPRFLRPASNNMSVSSSKIETRTSKTKTKNTTTITKINRDGVEVVIIIIIFFFECESCVCLMQKMGDHSFFENNVLYIGVRIYFREGFFSHCAQMMELSESI
jgi:hypothetical protein